METVPQVAADAVVICDHMLRLGYAYVLKEPLVLMRTGHHTWKGGPFELRTDRWCKDDPVEALADFVHGQWSDPTGKYYQWIKENVLRSEIIKGALDLINYAEHLRKVMPEIWNELKERLDGARFEMELDNEDRIRITIYGEFVCGLLDELQAFFGVPVRIWWDMGVAAFEQTGSARQIIDVDGDGT